MPEGESGRNGSAAVAATPWQVLFGGGGAEMTIPPKLHCDSKRAPRNEVGACVDSSFVGSIFDFLVVVAVILAAKILHLP
jgi:hypothetical protein